MKKKKAEKKLPSEMSATDEEIGGRGGEIIGLVRGVIDRGTDEELYRLHLEWLDGRWRQEVTEEEDYEIGRTFLTASARLTAFAATAGDQRDTNSSSEPWKCRRWAFTPLFSLFSQDEDLHFVGAPPQLLLPHAFAPGCPKVAFIADIYIHSLHDTVYYEVRQGNGIPNSAAYAQQFVDFFVRHHRQPLDSLSSPSTTTGKEQEEKEKENEKEKEMEKESPQAEEGEDPLSELYRYAARLVRYNEPREVTEASEVRNICFDLRRCERDEAEDPNELLADGVWTARLNPEKLLINAKTGALSTDPIVLPPPPSSCLVL